VPEVGETEPGESPVEHASGVEYLAVTHEMDLAGYHEHQFTEGRTGKTLIAGRGPAVELQSSSKNTPRFKK
jgi:hypothetical protein